MEGAEEELERRSKFLNSLIQKKKANEEQEQKECLNVRVGASDMPLAHQNRAFRCARDSLDSMPKLDTMSLALSLKKEFDSFYGPAWHCIVGTSFGSYVTHSLGGFLYFSIDKYLFSNGTSRRSIFSTGHVGPLQRVIQTVQLARAPVSLALLINNYYNSYLQKGH
ncbi:uncharacterized protein LOC143874112 isoform X4 [Tasmannia lanceolata]|uniref:uncharacterized protein LOC143874112 isoform X4 n=1 Tax=Tasmannia lanceolata TaxID=3420 RepID=UPI004063757C